MKAKIGRETRAWTVHPRPNGGDLVVTSEDGLVRVIDPLTCEWADPYADPFYCRAPSTLPKLGRKLVDDFLDAEDRSRAEPYPIIFEISGGLLFELTTSKAA